MSKKNVSICAFIGLFVCIYLVLQYYIARNCMRIHLMVCIQNEQMSLSVCVRACVRLSVCVLPCERYERTQLSTMFFLLCCCASPLLYIRFYFCFDFVSVCVEPNHNNKKKNTESKQMNERKRREKQTNSALLAAHSIECMHTCSCSIDIYIMLYFAIDTQIASNL